MIICEISIYIESLYIEYKQKFTNIKKHIKKFIFTCNIIMCNYYVYNYIIYIYIKKEKIYYIN